MRNKLFILHGLITLLLNIPILQLDIVEPKLPDDVMKNHSDPQRAATHDQSKIFLASTFVNGFVNCAFGKDKVTMDTDNKAWFGKAKDNGMISAVASLGLILLWDIDTGLTHIDSYLYSEDVEIKVSISLFLCPLTEHNRPKSYDRNKHSF